MRSDRYKEEPKKKNRGPLRALLVLILVLTAAIAAITAYFYKTAKDSLYISFTEDSPSIEFGGDYPAMDYVQGHEGDISTEAELLDSYTVGPGVMTYTVSKPVLGGLLNPSAEYTLSYNVVDKEKPLVMWSGNGTVLERGGKFDINNIVSYGDNADPEPSVDVEGKVDMDTNGDYPLHVKVTDASGNSEEWDLTITVADSVPSYTDDQERTAFSDFTAAYKDEGSAFGIDVSEWQGDIDFEAVKAAGCEFVMIRIGYGENGDITVDETFGKNIERAKAAGLKTGIYLYSYDNTPDGAAASAKWAVEKLGGAELDLPVAFDWEEFGNFQTYKISFKDLNDLYTSFAGAVSEAGYDCMLYGNKNSLEKVWYDTGTRPVWLAHYTEKTDYKSPFMMWQASCTGRIDGIDGDVDMDILY